MIIHDVQQGTSEWLSLRMGIPTASCFAQIITPTGKESAQADTYMNKLLAEILTGKPAEFEQTDWMQRGNDLEDAAAQFYAFQDDIELQKVGFVTDINRMIGCSPDRLIRDDGLLEIKCPAPWTHVDYLLNKSIDQKYYPQIQGQLFITGRKWCDIISYHPEMAPVIIRVNRNEEYIDKLSNLLADFHVSMHKKKLSLIDMGYLQPLTQQEAA